MTFGKRISGATVAMLLGSGLSALPAQAAYIATLTQVGSNVVATGSGSIDLTGLHVAVSGTAGAFLAPDVAATAIGPTADEAVTFYSGSSFTGPTSFGAGLGASASSGGGDTVALIGIERFLGVPAGYVSDSPLSDTSTYDGQTFASLGATPGTYVWRWGIVCATTGLQCVDDTFTLKIGVPEPSGAWLLTLPLGVIMLLAAWRGRANG
jgi:hypothetical protein